MSAVARLHSTPTALDRLRDHRQQVARLHTELTGFNALMAEHNQLQGVVAKVEAAISAAQAVRWVDAQEVGRLQAELDSARAALDRFTRRHRDDLARAERLQREYAAVATGRKALEADVLLEHAMTAGIEGFNDAAELYVESMIDWCGCWLAVARANGRDAASVGMPFTLRLPAPINAPKSAALEALRVPRDLTARIEQRARELLAEIRVA